MFQKAFDLIFFLQVFFVETNVRLQELATNKSIATFSCEYC